MDALDFTEKSTVLMVDDTPDNLSLMSGLLKDLYKVKVANNGERAIKVVLKPGRFTEDEFAIMRTHCALGRDAITHAETQLGMGVEFLRYAKEIAAMFAMNLAIRRRNAAIVLGDMQ